MLTLDLIMAIFVILAITAALGAALAALASAVLPAHTHRRLIARIGASLPAACLLYTVLLRLVTHRHAALYAVPPLAALATYLYTIFNLRRRA